MGTPVTIAFSSNILAKEFCEEVLLLSKVMIPVVGETSPDHMNFCSPVEILRVKSR
jgi:hypothetical protein